jgi:Cu+-exporting ATPase
MACDGCAQGLRGKLLALKGVVAAAVSQPEATALVAIELAKTSANDILTSVQLGHKEASFVSTINSKEYEHLALFPLGLRKECLNVACKCASCECIVCECGTSAIEMKEVPTRTPTTTSIEVSVEGMSCGSCAMRIQRSLLEMAGVRQAAVVFDTKKATVHFSRSTVGADAIVQRIRDLGYKANAECISTVAPSTLTLPSSFEQTDRSELEDSTSHNSKKLASPTATAASPSKLKPAATVVAIPQGPTVKSTFIVQGMTCASCAARIETTLIQKPGILSATVNFATSTASVSFDGSALHSGDVIGMIDSLGYVAQAQNNQSNAQTINQAKGALERTEEIRTMLRRFLLSVIFTLPLFVLMMVDDKVQNTFLAKKVYGDAMVMEIVSWVLSTPVVFIFGRHFFIRAAVAARHRSATMDTLVAVGVGGAYGFSTIGIILELASVGMMKNYFDAAAELITFMLLGKFLEAKAKRGTSGALLQLMTLAPQKSILVKKDGSEMEVETSELMVDDLFRVPSGGRIAVDGIVENGASAVDEQLITGESVPVDKRKGDKVIAGTLCLDSDLVVKATKVGSDTTLARILQVVQDAQTTKPAIQRLADKVASVFVPFILIYSSIVLGLWLVASYDGWYPAAWRGDQTQFIFSFQFFLSSVVVACPCAMGLAVPTAMMVGTGIAAKNGLLVKDGPTLETVSKSNVVLFDKTGTLTTGILAVDSTVVNSHFTDERLIGLSETELKMLVGTVESRSTHPVAVAITKAYGTIPAVPESQLRQAAAREANGGGSLNGSGNSATKTSPLDRNYSNSGDSGDEGPATPVAASTTWNLPAAISNLNVVTKAGNGVEATLLFRSGLKRDRIVDVQLVVGKPSFLRSEGFAFDAYTEQAIKEAQGKGCTVVAAAINGTVAVVTALSDQPKETAAACVKALFAKGREVFMVSGDHTLAALHIASLVGIPPENVHAEVLPWNKAEVVKSHQGEGKVVCFVGDGLNDSPALTQADVGVALGAGTEIAIEAADAVLMKNSLQDLVTFFDLSRTIIRRVYFNFVWAFMYNLVMLPLTSGLLFILTQQQIPPVVAGIAMVSSSLTVLASSLALKLYTPPKLNRDSAGRRGDRVSLLRQ